MTIAALRALLDEEQPWVRRHSAPWIPHTAHKRTEHDVPYDTPAPQGAHPSTRVDEETASLSQLLRWADDHQDKAVRDQGERVAASLTFLRQRWEADQELTAITTEKEKLQKRLAELAAREAQIAPKKAAKVRDHEPAVVRAWARAQGIDVPALGRVPKHVVDAWRQRDDA